LPASPWSQRRSACGSSTWASSSQSQGCDFCGPRPTEVHDGEPPQKSRLLSTRPVHGHILITPAADESDVTHYNIFWASNRTARTLIRSVARGITSYHLHDPVDHSKGVKIPAGVNQLMVKTSNSLGMMQDGVTVDIWDYWQPAFTSLLKGLFRGG
ncbi:unnamed protein product, partial [Polarella glacialis]